MTRSFVHDHPRVAALPFGVALFVGLAFATSARAYSVPEAYFESAAGGGGGGRWFTGSPADGLGCGVCHSGGQGQRTFPLYVSGLPQRYAANGQYVITLSWPEFTLASASPPPVAMAAPDPNAPLPGAGMIAELVAESGGASGTIEISSDPTTYPGEFCQQRRANIRPRLAVKLYQVRAGVNPRLIRPDDDGVLRCESQQLGQRCLISLTSCGAQQVRFRWTSPSQWQGPIWFSAGFVTSENVGSTPKDDSVFEATWPVIQADSQAGLYEETLMGSACSVDGPGTTHTTLPTVAWMLAIVALSRRRPLRGLRRWLRGLKKPVISCSRAKLAVTLLALLAGACAVETTETAQQAAPLAGLHTPGSRLGASDPTDIVQPSAGLGNRCPMAPAAASVSPDATGMEMPATDMEMPPTEPSTPGTLAISYATRSLEGRYAPKNCTAVWIEDSEETYVATLEVTAGLRRPGLLFWQEHACTDLLGPDVMTSATLRDHTKTHDLVWSGTDVFQRPIPDGSYSLWIEVTETDKEPGLAEPFPFTKGATPYVMDVPVAFEGPLSQLSITWTPGDAVPAGAADGL